MPKIQLSPQEIQMITDTEWIYSKQRIIKKVYELFGELSEEYKKILSIADPFPNNISSGGGKISKGENYLGLPYVIMDHPATFSRDGVLAVRTMFWWGNFFSITLHISGSFKMGIQLNDQAKTFLENCNFFIASGDEWDHHFEKENYTPVNVITTFPNSINERAHFKLAKKIGLTEWENAGEFLLTSFREIIDFMLISYQGDKKGL